MANAADIISDWADVESLIENGYLRQQWHPSGDYRIINYTHKADYDAVWTPATLMCRGLILDTEDTVVARSFPRFFSLGDDRRPETLMANLPDEFPVITHKEDGFLSVSLTHRNSASLTSRGSFTSEYAVWANEFFFPADRRGQRRQEVLLSHRDKTFVFEILYPHRRIVVDNSGRYGLVLLAVIDVETGRAVSREQLYALGTDLETPVVRHYDTHTLHDCLELQKSLKGTEHEGFVAYFPEADFRVKIKGEDYCRIHRLATRMTKRRVWQMLREGDEEALYAAGEILPPVYVNWLNETVRELKDAHSALSIRAARVVAGTLTLPTRKDVVDYIREHGPDVFHEALYHYDGDYDRKADAIWKKLKPEHEIPLLRDGEDE